MNQENDISQHVLKQDILQMASDIVSSYVGSNLMDPKTIPDVIETVFHALLQCATSTNPGQACKPAISIKSSIQPDFLVCLEDGKKLKMLKRHLRTSYNMTPEEYRSKWGLPASYPMVAPNYAKRRSDFARKIGLGKARTKARKTASV
ncbi:MAG TPA: transcriptional regulator [Rhodospirillaceae bacterium]|nr:MAG: transcriptional regulator [Alphaproteobacteria bacterium GWF2_58_20]HAU28898.1 transcriptional regulator [Rhodospirillaceae bacterium]